MEKINQIVNEAIKELQKAEKLDNVLGLQIRYLGKNGVLTGLLKSLKEIPEAERPGFGKAINSAKARLEDAIRDRKEIFEKQVTEQKIQSGTIDITLPGKRQVRGKLHPITKVMEEMIAVFCQLGFSVAEGPDIETDYYNFEALNIPKYHPSRDMWSTLWITDEMLLRTHTSPVQIRVMEKRKPPVAVIAPGRVYRRDADVTHSTVFHQLEGLLVDKGVTFGDLKGTLTKFLHTIFGKEKKVRFRPSYFPFTEPSAEVDVECVICSGAGCRVCSHTGWLEILGSGMVDPNVFRHVKYDPQKYTGFAFGVGVERVAMLKYGINDIRLFYENDLRFLGQF